MEEFNRPNPDNPNAMSIGAAGMDPEQEKYLLMYFKGIMDRDNMQNNEEAGDNLNNFGSRGSGSIDSLSIILQNIEPVLLPFKEILTQIQAETMDEFVDLMEALSSWLNSHKVQTDVMAVINSLNFIVDLSTRITSSITEDFEMIRINVQALQDRYREEHGEEAPGWLVAIWYIGQILRSAV